jgi:hypothetical protein
VSEAAGSAQRGGAYRSSPCQWLREQRETERAARGAAGTGLKAAAAAGDRVLGAARDGGCWSGVCRSLLKTGCRISPGRKQRLELPVMTVAAFIACGTPLEQPALEAAEQRELEAARAARVEAAGTGSS